MKRKAELEIEREINTYWDLYHASCVIMEIAKEVTEGKFYLYMSSIVLSAFTIEAYLNHVGKKLIPYWNEIESIRITDKLTVICKHVGVEPDNGSRPFQVLTDLFKFRNALAHGKSKIEKITKEVDADDKISDHTPREHWEKFCNEGNAMKVREDVKEIIQIIHDASGIDGSPFISGITVSGITQK